jgi:hypothetical protein
MTDPIKNTERSLAVLRKDAERNAGVIAILETRLKEPKGK